MPTGRLGICSVTDKTDLMQFHQLLARLLAAAALLNSESLVGDGNPDQYDKQEADKYSGRSEVLGAAG